MKTLTPIGNRALIRPDEPASKSKGGIIMPDAAKEKPRSGKVIAVGGGKQDAAVTTPCPVTEGQRVLYGAYAGHKIDHDGNELLVLDCDEILAVIKE